MQTIEISEETKIRANRLDEIYKAGRLFTKDRGVQKTCEVFLAVNDFAEACGRDIAKASGEEDDEMTQGEILYNFKARIRQRVSQYYCAEGVYDFDTQECYYVGIVRC
jgi:hypothetical protein